MEKISIRNATFAKIGLHNFCKWINNNGYNTKEMTLIEIGSYVGDSTQIFLEYFKKVISIDPYINGYDDNDASSYKYDMKIIEKQFVENTKRFDNLERIVDYSENVVKKFEDNSIDIVYVDGLHSYEGVKKDLNLWYPKIKEGMIISGHDYKNKHHPGVKKAVEEFFNDTNIMRFQDSSWVRIKF